MLNKRLLVGFFAVGFERIPLNSPHTDRLGSVLFTYISYTLGVQCAYVFVRARVRVFATSNSMFVSDKLCRHIQCQTRGFSVKFGRC